MSTTASTASDRYEICLKCPFITTTDVAVSTLNIGRRCTLCGCFMKLKTKLPNAKCADKENPRW